MDGSTIYWSACTPKMQFKISTSLQFKQRDVVKVRRCAIDTERATWETKAHALGFARPFLSEFTIEKWPLISNKLRELESNRLTWINLSKILDKKKNAAHMLT